MTKEQKGMSVYLGIGAACALALAAAGTVATGDVRLQLAGLDVNISSHTERGFVVKIDGAECPGAGCPAFALDWKLTAQG